MTSEELKAELKRRGWRQAELARRLGVSPVTVNRWAQDKQAVHPAVAAYLRDVPDLPRLGAWAACQGGNLC